MTNERVVVTGIGPVSSVGSGKDAFWDGLARGRSGISRVESIPPEVQSACKIAGEIKDFEPTLYG